ncbi:MAG: sugar transferase [Pseudomonadota bacterium]
MPRWFDIAFTLLASLILAPLLVLIAGSVLLAMGRPIFFRQLRVGANGAPFTIWKFRSFGEDGRPTALGRILRRLSLDELPEFWNVLRGDMAVVGPRPLIEADQPQLPSIRKARQAARPGITGWAQVNGRNALSFEESYRYDLAYIQNRSAMLDLQVLAMTMPCVISGRGACGLTRPDRPVALAGPKRRPLPRTV